MMAAPMVGTDRLRELMVFTRVVALGSQTAAGRALGLSPSAVSRQIAALENRLGARLLNRTTRRLSLTEAGAAFHARCVSVLAMLEEAERAVGDLQQAPRGRLRISAAPGYGERRLGPAIAAFAMQYPEVTLDMTLDVRVVDLVDEGFDLAIRLMPLQDSSLIARYIDDMHWHLYASPDYLADQGSPETLDDLTRHRCFAFSDASPNQTWNSDAGIAHTFVGAARANSSVILMKMACAGGGIVRLPDWLANEDEAAGRLVRVLPHLFSLHVPVHAVYPASRHLSPKVRAFVDFIAAALRD
jgi:DNA-binding transcriptional LysR family regulator